MHFSFQLNIKSLSNNNVVQKEIVAVRDMKYAY